MSTPNEEMNGGAPGERAAPENETDLHQVFEDEKAKSAQYLAHWQRAQADFVNLKRRTEQDRDELARYAGVRVILQMLPVLDDMERALDTVGAAMAGHTWVDGIRLIYRKLQASLEAQGLEAVPAHGEHFDPTIHEAVNFSDGEEGRVTSVLQKGYRLHDRIIRPAVVVVGNGQGRTTAQAGGTGTADDKAARSSEE